MTIASPRRLPLTESQLLEKINSQNTIAQSLKMRLMLSQTSHICSRTSIHLAYPAHAHFRWGFSFPSTINLKGLNHFLLRCTIRPPPPLEQIFQSFHHRICVHLKKCKRQSVFLQYVNKTLIFKPRIINKLDQAKHINKTFTCRTFTFSMPKIQLENLFSVWCWVRLLHS